MYSYSMILSKYLRVSYLLLVIDHFVSQQKKSAEFLSQVIGNKFY